MIRIIENGLTKEYEATCESCGSRIAYTKDNVSIQARYAVGRKGRVKGIPSLQPVITCPVCQNYIWINSPHFKSEDEVVESEDDVNPHPKYSYDSGLIDTRTNKPTWGLDFKWVIWELKHGCNPLKEKV